MPIDRWTVIQPTNEFDAVFNNFEMLVTRRDINVAGADLLTVAGLAHIHRAEFIHPFRKRCAEGRGNMLGNNNRWCSLRHVRPP